MASDFTHADFEVLIEIIKVLVLGAGAACVTYLFNVQAKKREQEGALFNEFLKDRIKTVHSLNALSVSLYQNYFTAISGAKSAALGNDSQLTADYRRFTEHEKLKKSIETFRSNLSSNAKAIVALAEEQRYLIGEKNISAIQHRLSILEALIGTVWDHYLSVSAPKIISNIKSAEDIKPVSEALYQVPKSPTHGPTGAFRST